ncbi:MAG TPA: hypothetical protein VFQ85_11300, partial [Mycobacteriales bacterium]|nr:hypothetical protein [Mycobacteriales bacterium]
MRGRRIVRIATAGALALAVCAPAADATSVNWGGYYARGVSVQITSAATESNDLTIVASEGTGDPRVIDVFDPVATLDDGGVGPASPGECDGSYYSCEVPCRIVTPHHARCVIDDGFSNVDRTPYPLGSGFSPGFRLVSVDLRGGEDRVRVPRGTAKPVLDVEGGDGGNTYTFAGADGHVEASSGDTVAYLPGSSGGVRIFGGGVTVEAV